MYLSPLLQKKLDAPVKAFEVAIRSYVADCLLQAYPTKDSLKCELEKRVRTVKSTNVIFSGKLSSAKKLLGEASWNAFWDNLSIFGIARFQIYQPILKIFCVLSPANRCRLIIWILCHSLPTKLYVAKQKLTSYLLLFAAGMGKGGFEIRNTWFVFLGTVELEKPRWLRSLSPD